MMNWQLPWIDQGHDFSLRSMNWFASQIIDIYRQSIYANAFDMCVALDIFLLHKNSIYSALRNENGTFHHLRANCSIQQKTNNNRNYPSLILSGDIPTVQYICWYDIYLRMRYVSQSSTRVPSTIPPEHHFINQFFTRSKYTITTVLSENGPPPYA